MNRFFRADTWIVTASVIGANLSAVGLLLLAIQLTSLFEQKENWRRNNTLMQIGWQFVHVQSILNERVRDDSISVDFACAKIRGEIDSWASNEEVDLGLAEVPLGMMVEGCTQYLKTKHTFPTYRVGDDVGDKLLLERSRPGTSRRMRRQHDQLRDTFRDLEHWWAESAGRTLEIERSSNRLLDTMAEYPYFPLILTGLGIAMVVLGTAARRT